jgi:hypothetical protein
VSHAQGLENTKERIISEFGDRVKNLKAKFNCKINTDPFEIEKRNSNDVANDPQIYEYSEAASETGSIFGIIVKIERN